MPTDAQDRQPWGTANGSSPASRTSSLARDLQRPDGSHEHNGSDGGATDSKASRLRKACDSCSIRKVKCDETGPPCKACRALDIPCTFKRPSRRRGPPNRHAEALKRQRLDSESLYHSSISGTTHASPESPVQKPLTAESIAPLQLISLLLDDFFTYIHPLQPFPHEPWFRAAYQQRRDAEDPAFLALLAAMIGALVASYPRRPQRHLKDLDYLDLFPNVHSLIGKCQLVIREARGAGYLDSSQLSIYDAAISYFNLTICSCTYDMLRGNLYLGECSNILRCLSSHQVETWRGRRMDYVEREMARRIWWTVFVTVRSARTFGISMADPLMPAETPSQLFPPLPLELDDRYIYPDHLEQQPTATVSRMTGFNVNCRIYLAHDPLVASEFSYGINHVLDWNLQSSVLQRCLESVKNEQEQLTEKFTVWAGPPSISPSDSTCSGAVKREGTPDVSILPQGAADEQERRHICYEVQKANIHASLLTSRSYFAEKFWRLIESQKGQAQHDHPQARSSINERTREIDVERESIAEDLLTVLSSVRPVHMEPNAISFSMKIRQIASTLLPDSGQDGLTAMNERGAFYLQSFLEILSDLDRSCTVRKSAGVEECDPDEDLRKWADMRDCQRKFAETGGG